MQLFIVIFEPCRLQSMKQRITLLLFALIPLFTAFYDANNGQMLYEGWTKEMSKEAIDVYTRTYPQSNFKEFKAQCTLKTSLSSLVSVLKNKDDATELYASIDKIDIIKVLNEQEWYARADLNISFPFDSRDMVIHMKLNQDATKTVSIFINGKPDFIAAKPDVIRIPFVKGVWEFKPIGQGQVQVTYQNVSDPGGYIPSWLVNMATVKAPYETLKKLKVLVQKPLHQNAKYPYITEP